jgi:DNA-binding MarR family transcriptional regulator
MEQHLGDLLYQANKELIAAVNRKLAGMNLGYSQLQALMTMIRLGDGDEINQEILAEVMQMDKSNVSRNLSKMQQEGYVELVQSQKDGRKKIVRMTEKGKRSVGAIKKILGDINDKMIQDFEEEEQKAAMKYLNQIIHNLEEMK